MNLLRSVTGPGWFEASTRDLGALLSDHLHCERKAAESALGLVRRYPHHRPFTEAMARLAHEETSHAVQVALLLGERGLTPRSDSANHYARQLLSQVRGTEPQRQVDLLLAAAFIEARSHERLHLLAAGFERCGDAPLAQFYGALAHAEERHAEIYIHWAARLVPDGELQERLAQMGEHEAQVLTDLPFGPRIH